MLLLVVHATAAQLWTITSGSSSCSLINNGACVTDGPDNYGNSEHHFCLVGTEPKASLGWDTSPRDRTTRDRANGLPPGRLVLSLCGLVYSLTSNLIFIDPLRSELVGLACH